MSEDKEPTNITKRQSGVTFYKSQALLSLQEAT